LQIKTMVPDKKSKKEKIYSPLSLFMMRTPLLPLEYFEQLCAADLQDSLDIAIQDPLIQEAIAVASENLHEAMPNFKEEKNPKKQKQVAASLLKYLSRMSTRPTPFGLFASVASGNLAKQTEVNLNTKYLMKRTRPDMEWLLFIVYKLEQRPEIVMQLLVQKNQAVQNTGGRIELLYPSLMGQMFNKVTGTDTKPGKVTVRATPPAVRALELSEQPIAFGMIMQQMLKEYEDVEGVTTEVIFHFLWELFTKEFLISELRPPLTLSSPLDYILSRLNRIQGAEAEVELLTRAKQSMHDYDQYELGQGLASYLELQQYMKNYGEMQSMAQVDLTLLSKTIHLNHQVGEDIAEVAEVLWKIAKSKRGFPHLKEYHNNFIEKYGISCDVPILELLNEETGLGVPEAYLKKGSQSDGISGGTASRVEFDRKLMMLMENALLNEEHEILITDDMVEQAWGGKEEVDEAASSIEIYAEVLAASSQELDEGKFNIVLGPNPGSFEAGATFGRFMDMLGEQPAHQFRAIRQKEQIANPDVLFAEATYIPGFGRAANVIVAPNLRDYEIGIGINTSPGKEAIGLDDVLVCATHDRLVLKSRSLGKQIIVTAGHMYNFQASPHIYRFMRELSFESVRTWQPFEWGSMENLPYLPRVRYRRTILAPARWTLFQSNFEDTGVLQDMEQWYGWMEQWRAQWRVPRFVYLMDTDNRILMDLTNKEFLKELHKELQTKKMVHLIERIGDTSDRWVQDEKGHYQTEFVFQLEKNQLQSAKPSIPTLSRTVSSHDKIRLPGSDWLYFKLYGGDNRQDEFITNAMYDFCQQMVKQEYCEQWYFIRYSDPDSHIRLRFSGQPENLLTNLLPRVNEWAQQCLQQGLIRRVVIDTYEREVERYGGPQLIDEAEKLFSEDSRTASQLVYLLRYGKTNLPPYVLGAISALNLLGQMQLSHEQMLELLSFTVDKKLYQKEFREWRTPLMALYTGSSYEEVLTGMDGGEWIKQAFMERHMSADCFSRWIHEASRKNLLYNNSYNIISSLLHMHFNRVFGVDREMEEKCLAFARHTIDNVIQYFKHIKR